MEWAIFKQVALKTNAHQVLLLCDVVTIKTNLRLKKISKQTINKIKEAYNWIKHYCKQ